MFLLILALGVAAVALAGQSAGSSTPSPGGGGGGGGGGLPPTNPPPLCPQLDKLPADLRRGIEDLIRAENGPGLAQAAIVARTYGLEELATCLELEAAQAGENGGGPEPGGPPPIVGPGLPDVNLMALCPSAGLLPADLREQLETMIETSGQGDSLRQIASTLALTMPELADCLNGLAEQKDAGLL